MPKTALPDCSNTHSILGQRVSEGEGQRTRWWCGVSEKVRSENDNKGEEEEPEVMARVMGDNKDEDEAPKPMEEEDENFVSP